MVKEITKTRESKYVVYQATDGTEFMDKEECKRYDESAAGMLIAKLAPITIKRDSEYNLLGGSEDTDGIVVVPQTKDDIDTIVHLIALFHNLDSYSLPELKEGHPVVIFKYNYNDKVENVWLRTLDGIVSDITDGNFKIQYNEKASNNKKS